MKIEEWRNRERKKRYRSCAPYAAYITQNVRRGTKKQWRKMKKLRRWRSLSIRQTLRNKRRTGAEMSEDVFATNKDEKLQNRCKEQKDLEVHDYQKVPEVDSVVPAEK